MTNLDAVLELAIGLVLVWLILSATTMEMQNILERIFQWRADFLEEAILGMFQGNEAYLKEFYSHPAIQELYRKGFLGRTKRPSYIPNQVFAEVVFEMFVNLGQDKNQIDQDSVSVQNILAEVEKIGKNNPKLGYTLRKLMPNFNGNEILSKARSLEGKAAEIKYRAENWFDQSMERASYWYKEKAQLIAFLIGLGFAVFVNVDTVAIAQQLWRDPTLRQSLVAQAQIAEENAAPASVLELEQEYKNINLPVGWIIGDKKVAASCNFISLKDNKVIVKQGDGCYEVTNLPAINNFWGWIAKIFGLLLSGIAAMQGAPFWFDILKKILDISGKSKNKEEPPLPPPPPPAQPPVTPDLKPVG
jgi:hypothetical protein